MRKCSKMHIDLQTYHKRSERKIFGMITWSDDNSNVEMTQFVQPWSPNAWPPNAYELNDGCKQC